jgi:SMC interacting uncharacterized protein involved in chromosome segregation
MSEQTENWQAVLKEMRKQRERLIKELRLMLNHRSPLACISVAERLLVAERVIEEIEKGVEACGS